MGRLVGCLQCPVPCGCNCSWNKKCSICTSWPQSSFRCYWWSPRIASYLLIPPRFTLKKLVPGCGIDAIVIPVVEYQSRVAQTLPILACSRFPRRHCWPVVLVCLHQSLPLGSWLLRQSSQGLSGPAHSTHLPRASTHRSPPHGRRCRGLFRSISVDAAFFCFQHSFLN